MSDPKTEPLPTPSRGHGGMDAGYDLFLEAPLELRAGETSGWVRLERPADCDLVLYFPRSSIQKKGLSIVAVGDQSGDTHVHVQLTHFGGETWRGERGDRVVQALFLPHPGQRSDVAMAVPFKASGHFPHVFGSDRESINPASMAVVPLWHIDTKLLENREGTGFILASAYEGHGWCNASAHPKWIQMCRGDDRVALAPGETRLFDLTLQARLQAGQALLLTPGATCRERGLNVQGVVDPGYSGPVMAVVTNTRREAVVVDRFCLVDLTVVRVIAAYGDVGARGEGGFGSSGR
jgi:dUTPase